MTDLPFELDEIDLKVTTRKGGAGLEEGPQYLALYDGSLHIVRFTRLWFGLSAPIGLYSPPHEEGSRWQRLWRIVVKEEDEEEIGGKLAGAGRA